MGSEQITNSSAGRKSYDSFDLAKFVLCFMVMIVHTNPVGNSNFHLLHPWGRIIIPVYFMISAFLFFSKYKILKYAY